jgi:catechol 2,3-dioxygenase-like lactoylglutathione lyase family enzyme
MHLILPGYGNEGPTLEIFSYDKMVEASVPVVNEPGFGHLAFSVADVDDALATLRAHGGSTVGGVSTSEVPGVGTLRVVYARDPEGNIIEIQNWSAAGD